MFGRWRRIADRFDALAAAEIGVDHVALDRAGANDRDLDDEVIEFFGLEARQHRHLRAALDLEDADRVGAAEHAVDGFISLRDCRQRQCLAVSLLEKFEGAADAGEHAEGEDIDLQHVERVQIVLVPFDEGAILHRGVHDGDHLVEAVLGHDEAADVLRQVAREADELAAEIEHHGHRRLLRIEAGAADIDIADAVFRTIPMSSRPARRSHPRTGRRPCRHRGRRSGAVGDDGRGDAGAPATVFFEHVLHHRFTVFVLEIDVDIGGSLRFGEMKRSKSRLAWLGSTSVMRGSSRRRN